MIQDGIKAIVENANVLIGWSLGLMGGSIAILVGSSHFRPTNRYLRLFYVLFIIGWIGLGKSMWHGHSTVNCCIMAQFKVTGDDKSNVENSILMESVQCANTEYDQQIKSFQFAVFVFGIWLCIYLFWWIMTTLPIKTS